MIPVVSQLHRLEGSEWTSHCPSLPCRILFPVGEATVSVPTDSCTSTAIFRKESMVIKGLKNKPRNKEEEKNHKSVLF